MGGSEICSRVETGNLQVGLVKWHERRSHVKVGPNGHSKVRDSEVSLEVRDVVSSREVITKTIGIGG